MPVTAGPWFSPVRERVSVANKSKNKSSSTTTNTNINTMEEEELNKNTNKNKKTPHLKTITTTTTTTTRQGGGMRITFSPSLLPKATATNNTNVDGEGATKTQGGYQEAGGLGGGGGFDRMRPLTITIDEEQVKGKEPCVITLRTPGKTQGTTPRNTTMSPTEAATATAKSTSTSGDLGGDLGGDRSGPPPHEVSSDSAAEAAAEAAAVVVAELRRRVETLERDKALAEARVQEALKEVEGKDRLLDEHQVQQRELERQVEEEKTKTTQQRQIREAVLAECARKEEEQEDTAARVIEMFATCFFDRCVTYAVSWHQKKRGARKSVSFAPSVNVVEFDLEDKGNQELEPEPEPEAPLHVKEKEKEKDGEDRRRHELEMLKVLSSYFFQQFVSKAEHQLLRSVLEGGEPSKIEREEEKEEEPTGEEEHEEDARVEEEAEPPLDETPVMLPNSPPSPSSPKQVLRGRKSNHDLEKELVWTMQALNQRMAFLESQQQASN